MAVMLLSMLTVVVTVMMLAVGMIMGDNYGNHDDISDDNG